MLTFQALPAPKFLPSSPDVSSGLIGRSLFSSPSPLGPSEAIFDCHLLSNFLYGFILLSGLLLPYGFLLQSVLQMPSPICPTVKSLGTLAWTSVVIGQTSCFSRSQLAGRLGCSCTSGNTSLHSSQLFLETT